MTIEQVVIWIVIGDIAGIPEALISNQSHYSLDMHTTAVPNLTHHVDAVLTKTV